MICFILCDGFLYEIRTLTTLNGFKMFLFFLQFQFISKSHYIPWIKLPILCFSILFLFLDSTFLTFLQARNYTHTFPVCLTSLYYRSVGTHEWVSDCVAVDSSDDILRSRRTMRHFGIKRFWYGNRFVVFIKNYSKINVVVFGWFGIIYTQILSVILFVI